MKRLSKLPDWVLITAASITAVIFVVMASYFFFQQRYKNKIYPGVQVAGISIGGLDYSAAQRIIEEKINLFDQGVVVQFQDRSTSIAPQTLALSPESIDPVIFDSPSTLKNAISIGRFESSLDNFFEQISALFGNYSLRLVVTIDRIQLTEKMKISFSDLEKPAENAQLIISDKSNMSIKPGQDGLAFNYDATVSRLIDQFQSGNTNALPLIVEKTNPEIPIASIEDVREEALRLTNLPLLVLKYNDEKWNIKTATLTSWIGLVLKDNKVIAGLDRKKIEEYLTTEISPDVTVEAMAPRLQIDNGRVTVWQSGRDGVELNQEATAKAIADWSEQTTDEISLVTEVTVNSAVDKNAEDLGLKEIIGTGISHFAGSPKNRRHNIKVGADSLNGLLIKPGEEFSLLKALGEIDGKHGYLPELVIKENKTIPEFGGGLCQVGTTIFRATFNSGLPVTQRRNHSYRVVYYEPAGTDATIYDPAPDYRFVNDTSHHILIQTRIEGDDLIFDLWGTKDGRIVEATKPVIYNIVQPGPTKIIETKDLPEGEKKCTEKAHAGADAYFDYSVTYSDGETKKTRFSSHYVPWQAVCLVGAKKTTPQSELPPTPTSIITPSISPGT
ncbi:VanW family protein [Candidatus Falkowbacteria bacterium]|nr:MAG: VanW family protein [Candidatus Falkowbacteria bacterium]